MPGHLEPGEVDSPPHHKSVSPIPPYLRPSNSRHHSSSSVTSTSSGRSRRSLKAHNQQTQYVAGTFDATLAGGEASPSGMQERAFFDEVQTRVQHGDAQVSGLGGRVSRDDEEREGDYESDDGNDSEADWNAAREGSISRRPAWRRPSPKWIYPFIIGAVLALGNAAPPRSELYVNLACLAHPPEAPSSAAWSSEAGISTWASGEASIDVEKELHGAPAVHVNATLPPHTPRSAADEWFLRLQREIYEYNRAHQHASPALPSHSHVSGTTSKTSSPRPTGPIPHPDLPSDTPDQGDQGGSDGSEGDGRDKEDPSTRGPPYREIDPALCKKSPTVQAAAARLTMVMAVTGGVLAALTTGQWGRLSDRIGRTKILAVCESGLMLYEIAFILVASFPYLVPGGYRALVIGPTFEGLVGGTSTLLATVNAYVSDTTPDGSRATAFARVGGMAMTGFALGPILGSWIINVTGNIMVPFYISACVHAFFVLYILLILPESLSSEARAILTANAKVKTAARKRKEAAEREWEETDALLPTPSPPAYSQPSTPTRTGMDTMTVPGSATTAQTTTTTPLLQHRASRMSFGAISLSGDPATHSKRRKRWTGNARRWARTLTAPLQPLEVFMPTQREVGDGKGMDWSMTFVACAMFLMATLMGFIQIKAQYSFFKYAWTSAQLGPYMSIVSFARGFVLIVFIPVAMKLAKPFFLPAEPAPLPTLAPTRTATETDPLLPPTHTDPNALEDTEIPVPTKVKQRRPAILDLYTIRLSLIFESLMFGILATGVSPEAFVVLSILLTFSSGHSPAANSLALTLVGDSRQSGRLFGGIAVIQALGTSLVGPLMYGGLFSATVASFAEGIFVMAACAQFMAFVLFMCVRLPEGKEEDTKAERGRSKRVKTVRSSSVGPYTAVEGGGRGKSAVRGQQAPRQETVVE